MYKILTRVKEISAQPMEDLLLFGPSKIKDPDTGYFINIDGYSIEKNQHLLVYIENVVLPFDYLHNCINDLFFFEQIFSIENSPVFNNPLHDVHYFRLSYQNWLTKLVTCFDCVLQTLNKVFELGLLDKGVNWKSIIEKEHLINQPDILNHISNIKEVLNNNLLQASLKSGGRIRDIRNKLIHYNEFSHKELDFLDNKITLSQMEAIDLDNVYVAGGMGLMSSKILDEVCHVNKKIITEVYPLFEFLLFEYKIRFDSKLITA